MTYTYKTVGTCSTLIEFELDNGIIHNVRFQNGCNGNLKAVSKLVEGFEASEIISKLEGNTCGYRSTSCADQFAKALKKALSE
ncbi:MAG: TIGR03905 family TSCPD domain-containing protein [Clostridia bacterium]|nr:TIGR03905 family TSCPD domain-containing protein [Clostridia bacterium]